MTASQSSCAGLTRASTSCGVEAQQDVDGRNKSGHDAENVASAASITDSLFKQPSNVDWQSSAALFLCGAGCAVVFEGRSASPGKEPRARGTPGVQRDPRA